MQQAADDILDPLRADQQRARTNQKERDKLSAEQRAHGGSTEFGQRVERIEIKKKPFGFLTSFFNNYLVQGYLMGKALEGVNALSAAALIAQFPTLREQEEQRRYIQVADTLTPDLDVEFAQVSVSRDVAAQIEAEIAEVRMQDMIITQQFNRSGFMGPFIEEKTRYGLMQEFRLRHDSDSHQYAHCITRVAQMEHELGYDSHKSPCMVRVFGVVSAACPTGRKPAINIAEVGAEMTVSDQQALEKAAQVIVVPPHLNYVP